MTSTKQHCTHDVASLFKLLKILLTLLKQIHAKVTFTSKLLYLRLGRIRFVLVLVARNVWRPRAIPCGAARLNLFVSQTLIAGTG